MFKLIHKISDRWSSGGKSTFLGVIYIISIVFTFLESIGMVVAGIVFASLGFDAWLPILCFILGVIVFFLWIVVCGIIEGEKAINERILTNHRISQDNKKKADYSGMFIDFLYFMTDFEKPDNSLCLSKLHLMKSSLELYGNGLLINQDETSFFVPKKKLDKVQIVKLKNNRFSRSQNSVNVVLNCGNNSLSFDLFFNGGDEAKVDSFIEKFQELIIALKTKVEE